MIDAHVHVWAVEPERYPWHQTLRNVSIPTEPATTELLLEQMNAAGVDHALLVQPSIYGWDNSYLCEALARNPERFAGVCLVDPRSPNSADDLRYWCVERGCCGMRVNLIEEKDPSYVLEPPLHSLWRTVEELGVSVSLQILPVHAATVRSLAAQFADVRFVVDYLGASAPHDGSGVAAMLELSEVSNIYSKLLVIGQDSKEAFPFRDLWPFYETSVRAFGAGRLVFGTDFPHVMNACSYRDATTLLQQLPFIDETDAVMIGHTTATALWKFQQG